jgi:Mn-dependent DtxR family transcriptional regulator
MDSASLEDYLRALFELADETGTVHSVEVARSLGVSKPSVHRAVGILAEHGYLTAEPYSPIVLTEAGKERGRALERRYQTIYDFLVQELGVDEETAAEEAHGIEHALSDGTTEKWMERFGS